MKDGEKPYKFVKKLVNPFVSCFLMFTCRLNVSVCSLRLVVQLVVQSICFVFRSHRSLSSLFKVISDAQFNSCSRSNS